ncbi:hypothetical protein AXK59_15975 [Tsukamurella tyrosinosolvens]|nr:hypothetical protein AXK59_15975 [Tsukamurella tyrosinosolvens]
MKRLLALLAITLMAVIGTTTMTAGAASATSADWAWPGQRFLVDIGNNTTKSCSVGYPGTDSAGNRYFITAGHCFRTSSGNHYVNRGRSGLDVFGPNDTSTSIGWEKLYANLNDEGYYLDISLVQMRPGKRLRGYGWPDIPARESVSRVGDSACAVGQRHNESTCGEVTAVGTEIRMSGYPWKSIVNRATYCSFPGDSGGLVYNNSGILGIVSAGPRDTCNDSYVPIAAALRSIRTSIPTFRLV